MDCNLGFNVLDLIFYKVKTEVKSRKDYLMLFLLRIQAKMYLLNIQIIQVYELDLFLQDHAHFV